MRRGAVVLAGGRGTRMGRDKASLPFGPETLLQRVVRRLAPAVAEVVVVARPGQALPPLPASVRRAVDAVVDEGPLRGLAAGLAAARADASFVTSCDAPFLRREAVDLLFGRLGDADAAAPETGGFVQVLAGVWRRRVLPTVEALLAEGGRGPTHLFGRVRGVRLPEADLRRVDPDLATLVNVNTPEDYEAALRRRPPVVRVALDDGARRLAGAAEVLVDAAALGEALREAVAALPGLEGTVVRAGRLGPGWRASRGGRALVEDPATPLADGETLHLRNDGTGR